MISAVILAAGESSRFGTPKLLFEVNNKTFLEHILTNSNVPEINEVILVLGYNSEKIIPELNTTNIKIVINHNYKDGQLSSFKTGIRKLNPDNKGILMILVDHPFVTKNTYKTIIQEFVRSSYSKIIIPAYNNRKGHPVIFPVSLKEDILSAPDNQGARYVIRNNSNSVKIVNVNDKFIHADLDYKADVKKWLAEK